jgi:Predicted nucleotide-binding protein containing TIR-like domain
VPIENLMDHLRQFDFAVFVFHPEDAVNIRGDDKLAVRDNVLFELGLFMGKLGRERNFFVQPVGSKLSMHLPSDLSGINPAEYDPKSSSLQASVGTALYQMKEAIRALGTQGPVTQQATVLYDSQTDFKPYHFEHRNDFIWNGVKPATSKGMGSLAFPQKGILKLSRTNKDGRNVIELRKNGPDQPSILKKQDPSYRVLHVSCEVKMEGGEHTLRFVAKDIKKGEWVDSKKRRVAETDWAGIDEYLNVPATSDLLFRIDDEDVSVAPSSVFIRNLKIVEEQ